MCVTSNVVCGTVQTYQDHHVREWINNCLPFAICVSMKECLNHIVFVYCYRIYLKDLSFTFCSVATYTLLIFLQGTHLLPCYVAGY